MTFNEWNKQLEKRVSDPQLRYLFAYLFEKNVDINQQLDMITNLLNALAESVQGFANLHAKDQDLVRQLLRRGRPDGVEVESVLDDPSESETKQ